MNGMFARSMFWFDANAGGGGGNGQGSDGNGEGAGGEGTTTTLTFDAWQKTLNDEQKGLIDSHVKGLKNALDSERGSRKDLEKQLRDLAKKAEAGSEAQTQLTKLADSLDTADRRTNFYEAAHAAGVKNLKLAFTVAETEEMFDKHGRVNFDEMKKAYPELFGTTTTPRGDAGSGTDKKPKAASGMNEFIRGAAGRS